MVKNKSKEDNFIVWRLFGIPMSVPINEVALQPAPPVAALTPPWQNCVVVTYTAWSTKPKTLTIWPFTQKVGWLLFHATKFGGGLLHSSSWLYNTSYYCLTLACEERTNANLTCTWCIWAKTKKHHGHCTNKPFPSVSKRQRKYRYPQAHWHAKGQTICLCRHYHGQLSPRRTSSNTVSWLS